MNKSFFIVVITVTLVILWCTFSFLSSAVVSSRHNCNKNYPIGYVFHTKLFCEIEEDK